MRSSTRLRRRRTVGALVAVALAAVVGTGCSGAGGSQGQTATTTTVLTPAIETPTTTIHGHTYTVPTEPGVPVINPAVATGNQIVLTDKGFVPYRLFANLNEKVTWTNLSSHPVTITFLHVPGARPKRLAVGGTFTYSSATLANFVYVSSSGYRGLVAIGDFP